MSIRQVHDIGECASFNMGQADAILQYDVGGVVLLENGEHFLWACLCIHLIKLKHIVINELIFVNTTSLVLSLSFLSSKCG